MQQIADWLKALGMSECAASFAENRIDYSVLGDPTDDANGSAGIALQSNPKLAMVGSEKPTPRDGGGLRGFQSGLGETVDLAPGRAADSASSPSSRAWRGGQGGVRRRLDPCVFASSIP